MTDTTIDYPYIGYRDQLGNIYEEEVAQEQIDILNDANEPGEQPLTLADLFTRVETEDFWQREIDNQEENSPEPHWRAI